MARLKRELVLVHYKDRFLEVMEVDLAFYEANLQGLDLVDSLSCNVSEVDRDLE